MKVVIYSCVTGGYDAMAEPRVVPDGARLVCFSDDPPLVSPAWEVRSVESPQDVGDPALINRWHKFFAHHLFPDADWSVYIDANIELTGDVSALVARVDRAGATLGCPRHGQRHTVGEEIEACLALRKFGPRDRDVVERQVADYRREGAPDDLPLTGNYLLVRRHGDVRLEPAMRLWWEQLQRYTTRDQISLPYVLWKTGLPAARFDEHAFAPNPYFRRHPHRRGGPRPWWRRLGNRLFR